MFYAEVLHGGQQMASEYGRWPQMMTQLSLRLFALQAPAGQPWHGLGLRQSSKQTIS